MKTLFRCDATADTGFGHLIRCIALAEALAMSGVRSKFAGLFDEAAKNQIAQAGFEFDNLCAPVNSGSFDQDPGEICAHHNADIAVIDSYRADEEYLSRYSSLGLVVVVIDDFCALAAYPCDVVLNFTWEAPALDYPRQSVLLLGPQYLLTRRQFVARRVLSMERDRKGPVHRLLIAIGGADPKAITTRIVRLLKQQDSLCVRAIAGNDIHLPNYLAAFAPGSEALPRQPDLSEQLLWADAAITGGGLIKYESAYMGVPAAAIAQNDGQDGETKVLAGAGLVFDLGTADRVTDNELAKALQEFISDPVRRGEMAGRCRETFVPDSSADAAQAILEAVRR